MTLDKIAPGHSCIIVTTGGEKRIRRRLLDLGLTPNTRITVHKVAPLGDPIEILLRRYYLTLRKGEARYITVEEIPTPQKPEVRA